MVVKYNNNGQDPTLQIDLNNTIYEGVIGIDPSALFIGTVDILSNEMTSPNIFECQTEGQLNVSDPGELELEWPNGDFDYVTPQFENVS